MEFEWDKLTQLLREEFSVGEQLEQNLAAQKKAIVAWDVVQLLELIDAREPWVRRLGQLEAQRTAWLGRSAPHSSTLRQLIADLPPEHSSKHQLESLRSQCKGIFMQLHAEEASLRRLMENLLSHIEEALSPLVKPESPTYGVAKANSRDRGASTLMESKA